MIGNAMKKWPSDALRRVCDAPVETWRHFSTTTPYWPDGRRCLLMHAADSDWACDCQDEFAGGSDIALRFDSLGDRFALPRVVRALKLRALRILESRGEIERTEPARLRVKSGT